MVFAHNLFVLFYIFYFVNMLYIFCTLILVVGTVLFYYWKQIKVSRRIKNCISMQIYYRFQNIEDQYSGNGRSKNGALIFEIERTNMDIRNVVIKYVKLNNASFTVSLDQLMMIAFPNNSFKAHEASLRFRIKGPFTESTITKKQYATIKGYLTSETSERIPLRLRIPILAFRGEQGYDEDNSNKNGVNPNIAGLLVL